jgi:hypothetical protein
MRALRRSIATKPGASPDNSRVLFAYDVLLRADHLTLGDQLILHALGAAGSRTACDGNCQASL